MGKVAGLQRKAIEHNILVSGGGLESGGIGLLSHMGVGTNRLSKIEHIIHGGELV